MVTRDSAQGSERSALDELLNSGKPYSTIFVGVSGLSEAASVVGQDAIADLSEVIARRIGHSVRGSDRAVIVEDDQYVVAIKGTYDASAFRSLQERIRTAIENEVMLDGKTVSLQVDFGFASYPHDGLNFDEVVDHAQASMERARRSRGRLDTLEAEALRETTEDTSSQAPVAVRADVLTGLPDAVYFRTAAAQRVEQAGSGAQDLAVVFCDIEKFKEYNLKYGYNSGDELLKFLADTLIEAFPGDLMVRLNSDRFCILTASAQVEEKLGEVHERVRKFKINSSIEFKAGICNISQANGSATTAQDYARLACDSIKGRFDHSWRRFDESLAEQVRRRQHIVDNFDAAMNNNWIEVYYQPIIRAVTGHICGLEALTRWNDPELGMLPPGEFIDVLEDAHLIHKLDLYMVRKVCEGGRSMIDAGKRCVSRSINLSRLDYQLCDIFAQVDEIVTETGFPREKINIEFTESAFTQDAEFFASVIEKFRHAGYSVWMDDFGSGYSSLNLLKDYTFDMLKIDMAFLHGLENDVRTRDIVSSVVDMAKKLGIQTLAEGVENEEQYRFLKSVGCEMLQGFYFSKPEKLELLDEWVEEGKMAAESEAISSYYNKIGRVNMLSPAPFEQIEGSNEELEFSSGIPLAIVERQGSNATIIVANDAFMETALATGVVRSLTDNVVAFNTRGAKLAADILNLSDRAKASGAEEFLDFYNFKELFTLRLMHVAEDGPRDAFLASLVRYDTTAEQARGQYGRDKAPNLVYLPERQETPWQNSTELDLEHTAIVVIDILGGTEGVTPGLEEMASNSVALVKAARAIGMPVIFNIDNHIKGLDKELELWGDHGVRGTQSGTIIAEFDVQESDFIIPKRRYNGFFETDLELTLRELGITTLIMVGADTNICVLQTLAGAYFYGYKTVVPSDATATFLIGTQEAGLEYFTRCYDTRVVTTADLLERMSAANS